MLSLPCKQTALLSAAALVTAAGLSLPLACPPRPAPFRPAEVLDALRRAGLEYDALLVEPYDPHAEAGLYLKRQGDATPWPQLTDRLNSLDPARRMPGCVRVAPAVCGFGLPASHSGPDTGRVQAGGLVLTGDPAELRRIGRALR